MKAAITTICIFLVVAGHAQKQRDDGPSLTMKGTLMLPLPVRNKLFADITESIGGLDLCIQYPFFKGLGVGLGGKAIWFGLEERAFVPQRVSGEVFRTTYFGKVQYERYTGGQTFYELAAKAGVSNYRFSSTTCVEDPVRTGFHWGVQASYYIHATENLAFGLMMGYEHDATRITSDLFCIENFPGRGTTTVDRPLAYFTFGLGFSTRLRKSEDNARGW